MIFLVNTPTGYLTRTAMFGEWAYTMRHEDAFGFPTADEAHQVGVDVERSDFIIVRSLGGVLEEISHVTVSNSIADAVSRLDRPAFERLATDALIEALRTIPDTADVPPLRDMIVDPAWSPWLTTALRRERVEIRSPR